MDERLLERFERLGQLRVNDVGIGLVSNDHVFAIDETIGAGGIARTGGGHRGQFQHIFFAHGGLASFCSANKSGG
jgi:hypothetical protein